MSSAVVGLPVGKGSEIGDFLTQHPAVNCISFTGGDTGISVSKKVSCFASSLSYTHESCTHPLGTRSTSMQHNLTTGTHNDIVGYSRGRNTECADQAVCVCNTYTKEAQCVKESVLVQAGMIPIQMELGGKDACIVCHDADIDLAAKNIVKVHDTALHFRKVIPGEWGVMHHLKISNYRFINIFRCHYGQAVQIPVGAVHLVMCLDSVHAAPVFIKLESSMSP
jgi:hypothetical protein